ncbi:MAG TPA: hypothetical protein VHV76_08425 [Mycobacteriales bacterium]|jgi:hypothetical protein|nr:hypothetical protein [Mycobacteriales bacterium]
MTEFDEKEIRDHLERAVAPIDPIAPPLDVLRARAVKLRRFRISAGGGLLAAAAAAVTVAVVVVPASGSSSVHIAAAPSLGSLTSYASSHGGKHVAGPELDGSHYVGAYATKQAIVVVRYASGHWHADGKPITKYGAGKYVQRLGDGGTIVPGHASFTMRYIGGDVSYFGGVIYDANGTWKPAHFGKCADHPNLSCAYAGNEQPYGHIVAGSFVSTSNSCKPSCAAGTDYLITWRWNAATKQFATDDAHIVKYKVYKVPTS